MLLYNKALDPYHTLLRIISIIIFGHIKEIESERLRIFDFITANPSHIEKMTLGKNLVIERNAFGKYRSAYNNFDPQILFESMKPIQQAAVSCLIEMSVLSKLENTTRLHVNYSMIPTELTAIVGDSHNSIPKDVISFIKEHLISLELLGAKGLKKASKLMEYKYDVV